MTKKKLTGLVIDHWLNELKAIILHEIMGYLVQKEAITREEEFWWCHELCEPERICIDYAVKCLTEFSQLDENSDGVTCGEISARLEGAFRAPLFISEKDHLIQILESNGLSDLSDKAQYRLYTSYSASIDVIEECIENTESFDSLDYLKSQKLNDNFRIDELGLQNDLPKIIEYHMHVQERVEQKKAIKLEKPSIHSSVKRNQYIDIYTTFYNGSPELHTIYKWEAINAHKDPFRQKILDFCYELVNAHLEHLGTDANQSLASVPDHNSLPIPPLDQSFSYNCNQYHNILIGLYCLINKTRYEKCPMTKLEPMYKSFREFVANDLLENFGILKDSYKEYASNRDKEGESIDVQSYVNNILTRRIKANIAVANKEVEKVRKIYFN